MRASDSFFLEANDQIVANRYGETNVTVKIQGQGARGSSLELFLLTKKNAEDLRDAAALALEMMDPDYRSPA